MDKETYTDPNGFIITKCCASCINQESDSEFFRICKKGHGRLRPDDSCGKDYEPKEISKKGAVMGAGRIKRNSYLVYLREHFGEVFDKVMLEKPKGGIVNDQWGGICYGDSLPAKIVRIKPLPNHK